MVWARTPGRWAHSRLPLTSGGDASEGCKQDDGWARGRVRRSFDGATCVPAHPLTFLYAAFRGAATALAYVTAMKDTIKSICVCQCARDGHDFGQRLGFADPRIDASTPLLGLVRIGSTSGQATRQQRATGQCARCVAVTPPCASHRVCKGHTDHLAWLDARSCKTC